MNNQILQRENSALLANLEERTEQLNRVLNSLMTLKHLYYSLPKDIIEWHRKYIESIKYDDQ